jgi:hypothetical protein
MARKISSREQLLRPALRERAQIVLEGAPRALRLAALELEAAIKEQLSQPGSGRVYKSRGITSPLARVGTKRRAKQLHQASAPGEPPAPDIGELRRTIGHELVGDVIRVGSPLPQARTLDRGGVIQRVALRKDGTAVPYTIVIQPRPFMEPAYRVAEPHMIAAVARALKTAVTGVVLRRSD